MTNLRFSDLKGDEHIIRLPGISEEALGKIEMLLEAAEHQTTRKEKPMGRTINELEAAIEEAWRLLSLAYSLSGTSDEDSWKVAVRKWHGAWVEKGAEEIVMKHEITSISVFGNTILLNTTSGPVEVSDEYHATHSPAAGGYYILNEDGSESYEPPEKS